MSHRPLLPESTLETLVSRAEQVDESKAWPEESWNAIMSAGASKWAIPRADGGDELPQPEQLAGSEAIASACMTTAFILSQREAAIRHVLRGPQHLQERYLPDLAQGKSFITIGLSQLTTSRQHQAPSLRASRLSETQYKLDGEIPWVTGAPRAKAVVIGATLDSGEQALFLLPMNAPHIHVGDPLPLSSLLGSQTCSIHCDQFIITSDFLLAGPKERVLGAGGGGGLETSCLALGLTRAAVSYLREESASRPDLTTITDELEQKLNGARSQMLQLASNPEMEPVLTLRADCTLLALRSTQAALLFAKGKGFVKPHPAQRWASQALFFLVWSCPRSVSEQVWRGLASPK